MPKRTIKCPNGCDPEDLERESGTVVGSQFPYHNDNNMTQYHCKGCGWTAKWAYGKFSVEFPGVGKE